MKLDKEQQKHFAEAIRNASKKKGFKVKGCSIYVLEGNAFIHCDYFVDSQKMFYRIYIKNYDIDEYVVNNAEGMNIDILKYLAYIHMNRVNEAQVIAEEAIKSGKVGNFKNEGKSFLEWAIMAE